jgi:hypothetical protein
MCSYKCFFGFDACGPVLQDQAFQDIVNTFINSNTACNLNLEQDRSGYPHVYSTCTCDQLKYVSSAQYTLTQYSFSPDNGAIFVADYPTSSPYVTSGFFFEIKLFFFLKKIYIFFISVGATQFTKMDN